MVAESDQLTLIIGKLTAVCMKIHAQTAQFSTSAVVCGELGYLLESARPDKLRVLPQRI